MNFEFGSSLFGDLFGENSSSGGVNTQSSSENRQNVASNQASSGQSSGSGKRGRRCTACKVFGQNRSSKRCS